MLQKASTDSAMVRARTLALVTSAGITWKGRLRRPVMRVSVTAVMRSSLPMAVTIWADALKLPSSCDNRADLTAETSQSGKSPGVQGAGGLTSLGGGLGIW